MIIETIRQQKEKKIDFFDYVKVLNSNAKEFYARLPRNQWIKFSDIPFDIFHLIFGIIDQSPNISVDKSLKEFIIIDKIRLPN
jgi:hypothetical protein